MSSPSKWIKDHSVSFNLYLICLYYVPDTILGTGDNTVNKSSHGPLAWNSHSIEKVNITNTKEVTCVCKTRNMHRWNLIPIGCNLGALVRKGTQKNDKLHLTLTYYVKVSWGQKRIWERFLNMRVAFGEQSMVAWEKWKQDREAGVQRLEGGQ